MTKLELVFGISSLIGMVIAIWQTIKARGQSKELEKYEYLFDLADKGIEKEKTQEELEILRNEKQKIDEAIKKELPLRAHLTVLFDRLKDDQSNLITYYNRYVETKQEYDRLTNEEHTEIPKSLISEIENQILPDYLIKERKEKCLRILGLISYIAAVLSYFYATRILGRLLIVISLFPLIEYGRLSIPRSSEKRKEYFIKVLQNFFYAAAVVMFLSATFIYIDDYQDLAHLSYSNEFTFNALVLGGIFMVVIARILFIFENRKKREQKDSRHFRSRKR